MKKLMLALAAACAIGFTAVADATAWFNGGVAEGWPTAGEGLAGGAWTNTDGCSWNGEAVAISTESEPESALTFTATDEKNLTDTNVTINTQFVFTPYGKNSLPSIPADAKAGIILVSTNTEDMASAEEDCYFYYVNYNDAAGVQSNEWKKSTITATIEVNKPITVSISKGEADGFYKVTYNFHGVEVEASVASTVATVGKVVCVGSGKMSALDASYEVVAASTLTLENNFSNMSVTNVSVNGALQGVAESYTVPYNGNVIVYFEPAKDYELNKDTYVITGMKENFTLNSETEGIPTATEIVYGTLTFYAPNEDEGPTSRKGKAGTAFTGADEINAWANGESVQKPYYWFNGKWLNDQPGTGKVVDFPTNYVDGTYYANITAITYKITYVYDPAISVTNPNPTGYTVEDENITLADPTDIPTGYTFDGWYMDETEITKIDIVTMTEEGTIADLTITAKFTGGTGGTSVAPGGSPVDVEAESAEAATNGVTITVSSPDPEIVSEADYKNYFYVKATELSEGNYRLTADLKPEVKQAEAETTEIAAKLSDIAAGTATSVEVTNAKPGLYYSVKYTDDVSAMDGAAEGDREQADASGNVTIVTPKTAEDASKQFYQIQVNTTDKGTVQ